MGKPLFSEMLYERRRQLGLSIKQASNVLRLKEDVLIAFEEGDFDSIPKSGYAQGMLSSYARYLGLNAKTVVDQFSNDLFEYEHGADSHEARRRNRQSRNNDNGPYYETPQAAATRQSGRRIYMESHGFLPTSGGFAGDMGDFATTSSPRPRYSSSSGDSSSDGYDREEADSSYPQGRPYTSRMPITTGTPLVQTRQRTSTYGYGSAYGQTDGSGRYSRYGSGAYAGRDDVTTRRVAPSQYRDDMRLDNDGGSYQTASSAAGRRSSRNIASTQRPNVRRRTGSDARAQMRNRSQSPRYGGIVGMAEEFFMERSHVIALFVGILCLILTTVIILSVRSCVNSQSSTGRTVTVTAAEDKTEDEQVAATEEETRAREEAAAAKAAESETAVTERTIEVTVVEGAVTWIEISYDGNSDIAETVTGPWNRTYTVRQAISISVNDTTGVTVTENGKKLEFDSKASGIGTINIQVSKKGDATTDEAAAGQTPDGQNAQQTADGQTTNGQNTNGQTNPNGGTPTNLSIEEIEAMGYVGTDDGNYYGSDGYYDEDGNFYTY